MWVLGIETGPVENNSEIFTAELSLQALSLLLYFILFSGEMEIGSWHLYSPRMTQGSQFFSSV